MSRKEWRHVYVVYRIDFYLADERVEPLRINDLLAIKAVYPDEDVAIAEVARLNSGVEGSRYFYQCAKTFDLG